MMGQASKCLVAGMLLAISPQPCLAQTVTGVASVQDGDSLTIVDQRVRLFGIDAPEYDQTCEKNGAAWQCGQMAKQQLEALVSGRQVVCTGQGADQHGHMLAVCSAGGDQLNRIMVEQGWAVAYRQYSDAYVAAELQAKTYRLGIWASNFVAPSDYRHGKEPGGGAGRAPIDDMPRTRSGYSAPQQPSRSAPPAVGNGPFRNCAAARAAGAAPMHRGDPGYNPHLDGDGDGIACERW